MEINDSSRNRGEHERSGSPSSRGVLIGTTTGIFHEAVVLSLWGFFGFESLQSMLSNELLFLLYTLTGIFALGFIPGLLYAEWGSISPGILIGGLLFLVSYLTLTTIGDGATPVGPTPLGWYTLLWVGIVVLISIAGWAEMRSTQ